MTSQGRVLRPRPIQNQHDGRNANHIKVGKESQPVYQRRNFIDRRKLKAKQFVYKTAGNTKKYGALGSSKWLNGLLESMEEPDILTVENVKEWVEKYPTVFRVPTPNPGQRKRGRNVTPIVRSLKRAKSESEDEFKDDNSYTSNDSSLFTPIIVTKKVTKRPIKIKIKEEHLSRTPPPSPTSTVLLRPSRKIENTEAVTTNTFGDSSINALLGNLNSPELLQIEFDSMEQDAFTSDVPIKLGNGEGQNYSSEVKTGENADLVANKEHEHKETLETKTDSGVISMKEFLTQYGFASPKPPSGNAAVPFLADEPLLIDDSDFLDIASKVDSYEIVSENGTLKYIFYAKEIVSIPDSKVQIVRTATEKYNYVIHMFSVVVSSFENWHGFQSEPRNADVVPLFDRLKQAFDQMQKELIIHLCQNDNSNPSCTRTSILLQDLM